VQVSERLTLAGCTPARHGCGRAVETHARRVSMSRRAPWRACGGPAIGSCGRACEFSAQGREGGVPGPKRTPAQALDAVAAEAGVTAAPPPGAASA
jgi:hypothetical protein